MASNRLPHVVDKLFVLAEAMADGLKAHESTVGVLQNTESKIRADLAAARAANSVAIAASATAKACASAQTVADAEGRAFIGSCKRVLIHYLGSQWSPEWAAAGFPVNSTATPKIAEERQSLVGALRDYLAAHPTYEDAALGVTAERAAQVFGALIVQRAAANAAYSSAVQANAVFDSTRQALRTRISGLISELKQLLGPEDPRWYAFGLSRPVDPSRPGIPENLQLTAGNPGAVYASWSAAPRAARYRVYVKETDDTDFTARFSTWDPNAVVEVSGTSKRGGSVWIQVSAVNDAGESMPCKAVEIVLQAAGPLAGMAA